MVYYLKERTEIIFIYGEVGKCAQGTALVFDEINQNREVSHRYVLDLVEKFSETGSVDNRKSTNLRVMNEGAQIEVLGLFAAEPSSSLRTVAQQTGVSHTSLFSSGPTVVKREISGYMDWQKGTNRIEWPPR